jgi:hypothetical protein
MSYLWYNLNILHLQKKKKSMLPPETLQHLENSESIGIVLERCRMFPPSFRCASSVRMENNIWPASIE